MQDFQIISQLLAAAFLQAGRHTNHPQPGILGKIRAI
jgi:hypothetical protein